MEKLKKDGLVVKEVGVKDQTGMSEVDRANMLITQDFKHEVCYNVW